MTRRDFIKYIPIFIAVPVLALQPVEEPEVHLSFQEVGYFNNKGVIVKTVHEPVTLKRVVRHIREDNEVIRI